MHLVFRSIFLTLFLLWTSLSCSSSEKEALPQSPTLHCQEGFSVADHACVSCPAGMKNTSGDDPRGVDTSCEVILCAENEHVVSNECLECDVGTVNQEGDMASGGNTTCDVMLCELDHHVVNNQCLPCPAGTLNAERDEASGPNTSCSEIICQRNFYVDNNQCRGCAPGSINDAGDNATGQNTICESVICGPQEHVVNHMCIDCPLYTTNDDGGDDASGANTQCDLILCEENEWVDENFGGMPQCEECPRGTTNAAGDAIANGGSTCDYDNNTSLINGSPASDADFRNACLNNQLLRLSLSNDFFRDYHFGFFESYQLLAMWFFAGITAWDSPNDGSPFFVNFSIKTETSLASAELLFPTTAYSQPIQNNIIAAKLFSEDCTDVVHSDLAGPGNIGLETADFTDMNGSMPERNYVLVLQLPYRLNVDYPGSPNVGYPIDPDLTFYLRFERGVIDGSFCDPCLLYTSPSPRDATLSRMPSSA